MDNVTVVVLTKNEERNIREVVNNAKECTEYVLVVDSGSNDNTVAIAESCGAKVVYRQWDNDFAAQRNFAINMVKTDWILYLDADERLSASTIQEIKKVTAHNAIPYAYEIKREGYAFGQRFKHGSMRPDYVQRLFPTKSVEWVGKVHEHPETGLSIRRLKGHLRHYTYESWEQYWNKFNSYTTIWANDAYNRGKKVSYPSAFGHAVFGFLKITFFDKGILDGWLGMVMCLNHFMYTLIKYIKLADLYKEHER